MHGVGGRCTVMCMETRTTHKTQTIRFYSTAHCHNGQCEHLSAPAALTCEFMDTTEQQVRVYRETHGEWRIDHHDATWMRRMDIDGHPWKRSTEWV